MQKDKRLLKIYTIIVTYNGTPWIEACLKSLNQSSVETQMVVVDNGSTDETVALVRKYFPKVHIIQSKENLGFGKANNIGMSYALNEGASHVFLLNQDARVEPHTLSKLVDAERSNPGFGVLSPYHWNWDGTELEYYFSKFIFRNPAIIADAVQGEKTEAIYEVPFVNAAAWLIPQAVLHTVGGFDPIFHHYGEDDNYAQRLHYHGYKMGVVPGAYVYHDSKKRKEPKNYNFSAKYFMDEVKKLQIKYANPNATFSATHRKKEQRKILKWMLVNLVLFNFRTARGFAKKYKIFEKQYPQIEASRKRNIQKGAHYLDWN